MENEHGQDQLTVGIAFAIGMEYLAKANFARSVLSTLEEEDQNWTMVLNVGLRRTVADQHALTVP